MEKLTQKWTILCLLEEAEEGCEFYFTDFPLHVTLADVFSSSKTGTELAEGLPQIVSNQPVIQVEAWQPDMFGPNNDVEVMKLRPTAELISLYQLVYDWLTSIGVAYNSPEYQGANFAPHTTMQKSGSLKPAEKRLLKSVSLVDMFPNNDGYQRKIVKTIKLQ